MAGGGQDFQESPKNNGSPDERARANAAADPFSIPGNFRMMAFVIVWLGLAMPLVRMQPSKRAPGIPFMLGSNVTEPLSLTALTNLRTQAEQCTRFTLEGHWDKLLDVTHESTISLAGGADQLRNALEIALLALREAKVVVRDVRAEQPTQSAAIGRDAYGIVPLATETTIDGQPTLQKSYLLGISTDAGNRWTFVDGSALNAAALRQLLPQFPAPLLPVIA